MKNIIVIAIIFSWHLSLRSQDFDSLSSIYINNFLKASGGKDEWAKVKSKWDSVHFFQYDKKSNTNVFRANPNNKALLLNMKQPYEIIVNTFKSPNMKKNAFIKTKQDKSIMCVNQTQFWTQFGNGIAEVMPDEHRKYMQSAMVHCGEAYFFLQKDASASYVSTIQYKGNKYHIIKFIRKDWIAHNVYLFNSETHLIDYGTTERFLDQLGGREVDFVRMSHLKEYKNIDGFFIHTVEDGYKDNFLESRCITISTKFNINISDTVFEVPQN